MIDKNNRQCAVVRWPASYIHLRLCFPPIQAWHVYSYTTAAAIAVSITEVPGPQPLLHSDGRGPTGASAGTVGLGDAAAASAAASRKAEPTVQYG